MRETIEARFKTNWSSTPKVKYGENIPFTPTPQEAWVRIVINVFDNNNGEVGGRLQKVDGAIVVSVFTPEKKGEDAAYDLADDVTAIFQNENFGNVKCFATTVARVNRAARREVEGWFMLNVSTPFQYDVIT